jgi:hypothetical protein
LKLSPRTITFALGLLALGLLAGCANTPTSTPSPTVTVDRQAAGLMCDPGGIGDCGPGDTGAGGGVVFYDAGSTQPWGRYLEVAPAGWNGGGEDPTAKWCDKDDYKKYDDDKLIPMERATNYQIGTGATNTRIMLAACPSGAAVRAAAYRGGGKDDWFLPSAYELRELYKEKSRVGDLGQDCEYWSSSQYNQWAADYLVIKNGDPRSNNKYYEFCVRPVRAF